MTTGLNSKYRIVCFFDCRNNTVCHNHECGAIHDFHGWSRLFGRTHMADGLAVLEYPVVHGLVWLVRGGFENAERGQRLGQSPALPFDPALLFGPDFAKRNRGIAGRYIRRFVRREKPLCDFQVCRFDEFYIYADGLVGQCAGNIVSGVRNIEMDTGVIGQIWFSVGIRGKLELFVGEIRGAADLGADKYIGQKAILRIAEKAELFYPIFFFRGHKGEQGVKFVLRQLRCYGEDNNVKHIRYTRMKKFKTLPIGFLHRR